MKSSFGRVLVGLGLLVVLSLLLVLSSKKISHVEAQGSADPLHEQITFTANSTATTLVSAFDQAGLEYFPEDRVSAFPDPSLGIGTVVQVERALPIEIRDGKKTIKVRTWQTTIGSLLEEQRITIGSEDRVGPSLETPLTLSTDIIITRVARTTITETETIPFETIEREDPNSFRGTTSVTQAGESGTREKKYLLIREDGELISKTLVSNEVIKAVKNKIVSIGTKLKIGATYSGKATWYENSYGTKVATDKFKKGTELRITNLNNGKSIIVVNDGCICGATGVLVDLSPSYFQQLGGTLGQGVLQNIRVEEIL